MRRAPLLWMAGWFALGTALMGTHALSALLLAAGYGAFAALAGGAWWATRHRLVSLRALLLTACAAGSVLVLGSLTAALEGQLPDHHVLHQRPPTHARVAMIGRVSGPPVLRAPSEGRSGYVRIDLDLESLGGSATSGVIRATWYIEPEQWPEHRTAPVACHGDQVVLRGRLHVPTGRRNFADFDYAAYLARRHIHVLARTDTLEVLRSNCSSGLNRIQLYVGQALSRHVASDEVRAISRALLLGDRSGLSDDVRTQFADTGLMHLLAISGLHVMLLGLAIHRLLGPVLRRLGWRWSYVEAGRLGVTGLVLVGYALVTGAPASVVRAVVMAGFLAVAPLVARTSRPYNALGGAALVLLAWRPGFVFDAGFQLSFSAVGALLYLTPAFECWTPAWVDRRARFVASSIRASLAATLGTLPVLLWHFGQVGWGGLVLNLPAIPLTAGLLGASTLTALTAPFPFASASFGAAADVCGRILLWTAEWGQAGFGWAQTKGMIQNPLWAAVLVSGLVALGATSVRVRYRGAVCALLLASVVLWAGIGAHRYEPALDVVFFDVGQGDAALVRFPDGAGVLIDAGPASQYTNAGERAVLPHVAAHGIESIDAALVSHPHLDHYGGFAAVLREMPVGRLITNGQMSASPLYRGLLASADSLGVPVQAVRAGDTLQISPTARIEVLHPTHKPAEDEDPNEASLVVRVRYGSCSILFMGDAEAGAEHALLSMYGDRLRTDMVKVGHHGSKTSSTPDFVQATRARTAIVSVASRNRYGLPDEEALRTWDRAGADVIETRQGGAVRLRCTPDGVYHFSRPR